MSTAPALYRSLPFKPVEDFEHVGQVVDVPMTFIARKDLPPNDFKAPIDYLKANKDKVAIANAGIGAASHLCGLLFMSAPAANATGRDSRPVGVAAVGDGRGRGLSPPAPSAAPAATAR
jgi:tripartite-type tricarboxylate transporter receptor subunit TctC